MRYSCLTSCNAENLLDKIIVDVVQMILRWVMWFPNIEFTINNNHANERLRIIINWELGRSGKRGIREAIDRNYVLVLKEVRIFLIADNRMYTTDQVKRRAIGPGNSKRCYCEND